MVKTTTTLNSSKKYFEHDKLVEALMAADEILERCQIKYFLLEDTAWQAYKQYQFMKDLEELTFGLQRKDWTQVSQSLLKTIKPKDLQIEKDSIGFKMDNGVPITIWIINRKYEFFQRPDMIYYMYSEYFIPNPFMKYWKVRFLIK